MRISFDEAVEIAIEKRKNELSCWLGDEVSEVLSENGYNFVTVRRLFYLGYIFKNYHKFDSQIARDLGIGRTSILMLRRKMQSNNEYSRHGGDRRSKNFRISQKNQTIFGGFNKNKDLCTT